MTLQPGVFIKTLTALVAPAVLSASCNIFSTQGHAAVGSTKVVTTTVLALKGKAFSEFWWRIEQILTISGLDGYDQLNDDGGDTTPLIHEGTKLEAAFVDGTVSDPDHTTNPEC